MADTHKTFRQVILDAAKGSDLNLRDRLKLRAVLRLAPGRLERELLAHAQVEGVVPVSAKLDDEVGAVDWAALAEFIKEVLPAFLQIISILL